MKMIKSLSQFVIVLILVSSCEKNDDKITLTNNYLPLEIGNNWKFDFSEKKRLLGLK
jgi:hypothetical protein